MTSQCHSAAWDITPGRLGLDVLLSATRASILDLGLRRTTLAEVARRAAVSRMTVYRSYGDRDTLVNALLTAELAGAIGDVFEQVAELPTALARLAEAAVRVVRAIAGNPVFGRILDLDPELLLPFVVARLGSTQRAAIDTVAREIRVGRRDGSVRTGPAALVLAEHLVVALQGYVYGARLLSAPPAVSDREIRHLVEGYLAGTARG